MNITRAFVKQVSNHLSQITVGELNDAIRIEALRKYIAALFICFAGNMDEDAVNLIEYGLTSLVPFLEGETAEQRFSITNELSGAICHVPGGLDLFLAEEDIVKLVGTMEMESDDRRYGNHNEDMSRESLEVSK